jgi:hypothetical protein
VISAAPGLGAAVQQRVGRHHFRYGEPGTEVLAKLAERTIGDPGHGRDKQVVAQLEAEEVHVGGSEVAVGRGRDFSAKRRGGN